MLADVRVRCRFALKEVGVIPPMREITVGVAAPAYVNVPLWVAQRRGFLARGCR